MLITIAVHKNTDRRSIRYLFIHFLIVSTLYYQNNFSVIYMSVKKRLYVSHLGIFRNFTSLTHG